MIEAAACRSACSRTPNPERETIELGPDDQLFFYSNGVTEARNPDKQYFEDHLADELAARRPAPQTTRTIQDLVRQLLQDDLQDDMTILVARVRAESQQPGHQGR